MAGAASQAAKHTRADPLMMAVLNMRVARGLVSTGRMESRRDDALVAGKALA